MKALAEYFLFQVSAKVNCFDILYHHLQVVAIQKVKSDFSNFTAGFLKVFDFFLYLDLQKLNKLNL